ncbi:ABC transporter permease subunit [Clostridium vincentii]|uniref:ABC-2 family transporter protein n=1 Tax=Clostridium vincentii TaxID=52704 RepID=A0A2T0BIG9_9CLOT|nr:ABC transporter permease subunit [Clostridium vincentii]PRR83643.1 ABC-2 family transporter protein [Clostridium vincentii]
MNIFAREMKVHAKSLIIWSIGMVFMVFAGMGQYGGSVASDQSMNELLAQMPKSLQNIMGVGTFDLSLASGYYGILFLYLVLMVAIHAAMMGADIISKEERDKTSEFIFVKPVSRDRIITSKLSAAVVNILILNFVTLISSIVIVGYYSTGEDVTNDILKLMVGLFILQVLFLFIGTAISALCKKPKSSISVATGILLFMFMLSMAIDIESNLEPLKYLTPFKYFEAKSLMYGGEFQLTFVFLSILIIGICSCVTYLFYRKRDLTI